MTATAKRTTRGKIAEMCSPRPFPRSPVWGELGGTEKKVFPRSQSLYFQRFAGHWGNGGTHFRKYQKIEIIEIITGV